MCGELAAIACLSASRRGSSPRVRGTRKGRWTRARSRAVHPRVCGELVNALFCVNDNRGSSPRVRGTHQTQRRFGNAERFIPACAGNSEAPHVVLRPYPVHPRVCGELWLRSTPSPSRYGSSPRVRGTPGAAVEAHVLRRFIPACAGNSAERMRDNWADVGSSPRVRGTRIGKQAGERLDRFIPACAGNSFHGRSTTGWLPVHPRVCGELAIQPG